MSLLGEEESLQSKTHPQGDVSECGITCGTYVVNNMAGCDSSKAEERNDYPQSQTCEFRVLVPGVF